MPAANPRAKAEARRPIAAAATLLALGVVFACGPGPPPSEVETTFVEFTGPVRHLVPWVAGVPLFDPVCLSDEAGEAEYAAAVFAFARDRFQVFPLDAKQPLSVFFYGYGAGLCGEQSRLLVSLWSEVGLPSRIRSFPRHVLAEVRVDGVWRLYDAQHRVDYSAIRGGPIAMDGVRSGEFAPAGELDPIGYGWDHMLEIFSAPMHTYPIQSTGLPRPYLSLREGQSLRIRRRESTERHPLPLIDGSPAQARGDLLDFYLLELRHRFSDEDARTFYTGLPLLAMDLPGGPASLRIGRKGEALIKFDGPSAERDAAWRHRLDPLDIAAGPGVEIVLTYALAGWMGDRLFAADPAEITLAGDSEKGAVIAHRESNVPRLGIDGVQGPARAVAGERATFYVTLAWRNFDEKEPLAFDVYLEELSSELAMECLSERLRERWLWHPALRGPDGRAVIALPLTIDRKEKSAYRPRRFRNFLVRVVGPHVLSGSNHAGLRLQVEAAASPESAAESDNAPH